MENPQFADIRKYNKICFLFIIFKIVTPIKNNYNISQARSLRSYCLTYNEPYPIQMQIYYDFRHLNLSKKKFFFSRTDK